MNQANEMETKQLHTHALMQFIHLNREGNIL